VAAARAADPADARSDREILDAHWREQIRRHRWVPGPRPRF
jgi:hypothetical protein